MYNAPHAPQAPPPPPSYGPPPRRYPGLRYVASTCVVSAWITLVLSVPGGILMMAGGGMSAVAHLPANVVWLSRAGRSAARRTGKVLGEAILDHYTDTLENIRKTGFAEYWTREFRPYLRAAAAQFARQHESFTERLLRKQ